MIPWTLIIVGILCAFLGALILLLILLLPIYERLEIVFEKDKDILQARIEPKFIQMVHQEKGRLIRDSIIAVFVGIMMFYAGFYLGYAEKGENFWLYKKMFPDRVTVQVWDEINAAGQFVADDGKTYTYYVLIDGDKINFSGETCADLADFKSRLEKIQRENTVIIYDSFAVASVYRAVEDALNELGIEYEETK